MPTGGHRGRLRWALGVALLAAILAGAAVAGGLLRSAPAPAGAVGAAANAAAGAIDIGADDAAAIATPSVGPATASLDPRSGPDYGVRLAPAAERVHIHFKIPPSAGLLFDVRSGRVLWRHGGERILPIASLTKMMTALLVVEHAGPAERVKITKEALAYTGSGIGMLPKHGTVRLETLLYGLLLPSGNDAAIALAQHVAGSVPAFVRMMNERARAMRLRCTVFSSPSGILDEHNHSCLSDLALLAHAMLESPRLARIVGSREAVLPFPIKGGKLYLYNNNTLMRRGYPGVTGVKTGYTDAAGHCLVATARHGGRELGIVLLHSPDTADQGSQLLDAGFAAAKRAGG